MEDLDKDIVVFNDEEGNEIELEVVDYFDYENEEYAVMIDPAAVDDDERDLFVFRIQVNGEYEEFLPADEDKMDILFVYYVERISPVVRFKYSVPFRGKIYFQRAHNIFFVVANKNVIHTLSS